MRLSRLGFLLLACSSPSLAAWHEAKSKHFIIYADQRPDSLRAFATKLEKFDQAVRFLRGSDDPPIGDAGRLTVFVLRDTDAVSRLAVGGDSAIAGFYLPRAAGSVAFVPRRSGDETGWEISADTIFFHEYAHHLMLQSAEDALPAWLVEGFAEFYSTAGFPRDGAVRLGTPAEHRAYGLSLGERFPIEELLGERKARTTAERMDLFYGWGWLLTHYLTFEPARKGQLAKYLDAFRRGEEPLAAARGAFGDLRQLQRELGVYLRRNRFQHLNVAGAALATGPIEVRPLRIGEAAMMPVRMRSTRGVGARTAPGVAADARAAAAPFPRDPAVQTALAEAEFDAGQYAAAEAAADRALAADPRFAQAMIYKGKAQMEAAVKTKAKGVDWKAVRSWFTKANRLDPEDAEPLLLYYQSYGAAGQPATKNAVSGLLYAAVLAPQDRSLRTTAVARLITDKRLAEARRMLAPLAFDRHAGSGRDQARTAMDALARNDPQAALAALAGTPKEENEEDD